MSKKKTKSSVKKPNKPVKKANAKPAKKAVKKSNKAVKAKPAKTKKVAPKKAVKKAVKPKKKVVAKKVSKPTKKAAVKKAVKKALKPAKKKVVAKKIVKKVAKKVVAKKPIKKVAKKVAKPAKKVVAVKVKPMAKPVAKAIAKPVSKPVKQVEVKPVVAKKVEVKKQVQEAPKATVSSTPTALKQEQIIKVLAGNSSDKPQNEPAGKFELEYVIHSSASILFEFLTSPSGLSEWFCDDVNIRNENCSFVWDGAEQKAKLVKFIEEKLVRFQWEDKHDGSYFEFRIERDDLTNDISLIVTDFADTKEERESSKLLWDSQIEKLMKVLGSY